MQAIELGAFMLAGLAWKKLLDIKHNDIFQLIMFCVGFVGNTVCILMFSCRGGKRNFHFLMMSLAAYDVLYICCAFILFTLPHLMPRWVMTVTCDLIF